MGAALTFIKTWKQRQVPEDHKSIDEAVQGLMDQPDSMENTQQNYEALRILNLHLIKRMVVSIDSEHRLYLNRVLIALVHSGKFKSCMKKLFKHWLTIHTEINTKNIVLIKGSDIQYLEALSKFLLIMSENRSLRILDNMKDYRLDPPTENLIKEMQIPQHTNSNIFPLQNFIEMQSQAECQAAYLTLRNTLIGFLKLKTSFLTRSDNTLQILSWMVEHSYVLLVKIFFHKDHHQNIRDYILKQNPEESVRFAAYFLAKATDKKNSFLSDITVKFLTSLLHDGQVKKELPSFPTHLFPNIPVIVSNNLYQFILCNLLQSLSKQMVQFKEENGNINKRLVYSMQINRLETWRLILLLLEGEQTQFDSLSVYYLEQLCVTTKVSDIERVYLNKMIRFALKKQESAVLLKFIKSEKVTFQLNFSSRTFVLSELQINDFLAEHLKATRYDIEYLTERYLYGSIFQKRVIPVWSESDLWRIIKTKLHSQPVRHEPNGKIELDPEVVQISAERHQIGE